MKCIKDKDKGLAISYTVLPYCGFRPCVYSGLTPNH